MSQPDLIGELRAAHPTAPPDVRERVRLIAAQDATPSRRRLTWRAGLVLAFAAAIAVVAAVVATRGHDERAAQPRADTHATFAPLETQTVPGTGSSGAPKSAIAPAPSRSRVQRYAASLALRISTPDGVSSATKRALRITASLGGYPAAVHVQTHATSGEADLRLRIPRPNVQRAVTRLSSLGTIVGERVAIEDVQGGIDKTDRTIVRLQGELRDLRAQPETEAAARRIAALTRQIEGLQKARAAAIRQVRYATVRLHLATPKPVAKPRHDDGPLNGLGIAFRWIGIGAVYGLALGLPFVVLVLAIWLAARALRKRREDALLSSP